MPKIEKEVMIGNPQGLHARPAALFVQLASKFDSMITVRRGAERVSGKSIMGILMLAAGKNAKVTIEADGEDAQQAVDELERFLIQNE
ncbi:MAG: HPr family phosphocarrier protein [Candidatus Omnitrophota bacterium]